MLVALAFAGVLPREAAAAPAGGDPDLALGESQAAAPRPPPPDYATALTVAYTLAPLTAIPVGAGLFELTRNDAIAVVGAGLAVVAVPVTIHALNDQGGRAALSGFMLPVTTLVTLAVGGFLGVVVGTAGCNDDSDCELADGTAGGITGGLIGGLAGYVGYAIYDVSANSSQGEPTLGQGNLQLWALPVLGREQTASGEAGTRVDGALAGATLTF